MEELGFFILLAVLAGAATIVYFLSFVYMTVRNRIQKHRIEGLHILHKMGLQETLDFMWITKFPLSVTNAPMEALKIRTLKWKN